MFSSTFAVKLALFGQRSIRSTNKCFRKTTLQIYRLMPWTDAETDIEMTIGLDPYLRWVIL